MTTWLCPTAVLLAWIAMMWACVRIVDRTGTGDSLHGLADVIRSFFGRHHR